MKTKKNCKMSLQKTTIANLANTKMNDVKGGTNTGITCAFCNSDHSCNDNAYNCLWEYTCQDTCTDVN